MVVFEDEIRGKIEVSSRELDDKVLLSLIKCQPIILRTLLMTT